MSDAALTTKIELRISRRQLSGQKAEYSATLYTPDDGRKVINWMPLHRFNVELAMLTRMQADAFGRMTRGPARQLRKADAG